jgi:LytS/YehU family sensor histidine kinase
MSRLSHTFLSHTGLVIVRSFFPFFAIAVIVGATLWGPWVSLAVTVVAICAALRFL